MKGIILSAGNGTRLLPLTSRMPKCLVDVGGRAILDHQLDALTVAGVAEAVVVVGYRGGQVAEHLAAAPPPLPVTLVTNPFWAVSSSIGSVWAARAHLAEPFCLMNGDTVFAAAIVAGAIAAAPEGIGLLVEPITAPELDDMLVEVDRDRVRAVAKTLDPARAHYRSLGVILSTGGNAYRDALDTVIARPDGIHAYHHDIVAALAGTVGVGAIVDRHGGWQEIDRPEDIDRWTHSPAPQSL
ncbi:MAG TPA: NTP transferase domain-containing protein [Sphingomonas sp.]|nr:NTP transferase domain-containing protein [Sphingomonas sp.]